MTIEETGWAVVGEGEKWERYYSKLKLLKEPKPLDELLVQMLANSCGGHYYRVKGGEIYSQELDDKEYSPPSWDEKWEALGWTIAVEYSFNLNHNDPKILVAFKWSEEDAEGTRELRGGELIGYGFNYC